MGSFLGRRSSCEEGSAAATPLFVFDAGYDPVKLQQGLEGRPCRILVRLRAASHSMTSGSVIVIEMRQPLPRR